MEWNVIPPFTAFKGDMVFLSVNITANESFFSSEDFMLVQYVV